LTSSQLPQQNLQVPPQQSDSPNQLSPVSVPGFMARLQSAQAQRTIPSLTADEQYSIISKKDEGNIGGTLSIGQISRDG